MSSRSLADCSIEAAACAAEFENQMRGAGIEFVRACTYRSNDEQAALYALGRTRPGRIRTHAPPGTSPHNRTIDQIAASDAIDYYPLIAGKLAGDDTDQELALWHQIGIMGEACGLIWGGCWAGLKIDRPHFEIHRKGSKCNTSTTSSANHPHTPD